jgi:alpha-tubulin suppressor-like RCC1 family protein
MGAGHIGIELNRESQMPALLRRSTIAIVVLTAAACREDAESPTAPLVAEPEVASATQALTFRQVSGGAAHSCGVTTDDRAYCWGLGSYGQLGDGTEMTRAAPVAVAGGLRFRQVSAGGLHTCGVTTDNRAYCWGANFGALGDGTTTGRLTPVAVTGGKLFRQVSAGSIHTCGVSYPDDRAWCWGDNGVGELGDGTTTSRLAPAPVAGGRQFRNVSAGQEHTCGVTTTDRAFCWGMNEFGQLGDSTDVGARLVPSRVAGGRRFRQVDTGASFTCGVTTSDRAFCWGNGRVGQIGDGKTILRFWPRAVSGMHVFTRVTAGGFHACGVTAENRTYCWGWNLQGAVGDGTISMRTTPVAVVGGLRFGQVSGGSTHTCARTTAGAAYCWGSYEYGQLGAGEPEDPSNPPDHTRPTAVVGPT